jgi:hypothetical protein
MKLSLALVLASLLAPCACLAAPLTGPPAGVPGPRIPTSPVDHGPDGKQFTPKQPNSGPYTKPTPVAIERKVSVLADLELSIRPGIGSYKLHVLSSLPIRNLVATNKDTGVELASVKLDDAVDFSVRVDGDPNSATALTLDVNMGLFKGKQRIRQAVFDLMENAAVAEAKSPDAKDKVKEKEGSGDETPPAELKEGPAPE